MTEQEKRRAIRARRMKQRRRRRNLILLMIAILIITVVGTVGFCAVRMKRGQNSKSRQNTAASKDTEHQTQAETSKDDQSKQNRGPEADVYTYLQGVRSYESSKEWTGKWCYKQAGDSQFSSFGCGLCSIANVVSTLTDTKIDPGVAFDTAKEVSEYDPDSGVGAIGWSDIMTTLNHYEVQGKLKDKPDSYEEFQEDMSSHLTMIALISSDNDDSYWQDTPGHYITLWLYNTDTDEVFIGDSAKPSRNRQWIPLKTVYDALKTSSSSQYLEVLDDSSA